jgi:pilus assembly protein Flp/PilA
MAKFITVAKQFARSEEGASMVEYGLLVALIALVVAAAATVLGGGISGLFNNANNSL